jgi:hypothetical protein
VTSSREFIRANQFPCQIQGSDTKTDERDAVSLPVTSSSCQKMSHLLHKNDSGMGSSLHETAVQASRHQAPLIWQADLPSTVPARSHGKIRFRPVVSQRPTPHRAVRRTRRVHIGRDTSEDIAALCSHASPLIGEPRRHYTRIGSKPEAFEIASGGFLVHDFSDMVAYSQQRA